MPSRQPVFTAIALFAVVCLPLVAVGTSAPPVAAQSASGTSSSSYVSITNVTHTPETPTVGERYEIRTVIKNHDGDGGSLKVNEVYIRGRGTDRYIADDLGRLPPGSSMPVTLPMTTDEPGRHTYTVKVHGTNPSGSPVTIQHPVTVNVVNQTTPELEVSTESAIPGSSRPLNVTVGNGGPDSLNQVAVTVSSETVDFGVQKRVRSHVGAHNATTVQFPATVSEAGTHRVDVTLTYLEDGERREVTRTAQSAFDAPNNPGEIRLTGVEAVSRGGSVELSATASNVGTTEVSGVVVSVADSSDLGSADYFVGSVEASDFSSFTLRTRATGNVSSVPVRVRYVVDDVERSYTTTIPVQGGGAAPVAPGDAMKAKSSASGGGLPLIGGLPLLPIAAVVGVVVLVAGYRWRS